MYSTSELTINQLMILAKKELNEYNSKVYHTDDNLDLTDWLTENAKLYEKEYGIYYSTIYKLWMYTPNNLNYKGDEICQCCFSQCETEESGLCVDCDSE